MYKKHSIEERLLAVQKCIEGYSPLAVQQMLGIHRDEIRVWLLRYKREGVSGLQKHPVKRADFAEKCKIVCEFVEKGVPLHKICAAHQVSRSALKAWIRIYRKGGYLSLIHI